MEYYLKESLKTNKPLKVLTKNNKVMVINLLSYDNEKVCFYCKNTYKKSYIKRKDIIDIDFFYTIESKRNKSSQKNDMIKKYSDYYKKCIKVEDNEEKNLLKEELFDKIFYALYQEQNNLLFKYFTGGNEQNKETELIDNYLLISKSNISQRQAIKNALNNRISIVEGPPGTGKTQTILSIIANMIIQNKKVVVVSKNNTAVDNIIEEFKKIDLPDFYVRFGKKEVMNNLLININNKLKKLDNDLKKIKINKEDLEQLNNYKNKLNELELDINGLIDLKNSVIELKNQKKFIDRSIKIYDFKKNLSKEELNFINKKNVNVKTINRIIKMANKDKYNFFDKVIIKIILHLKNNNLQLKLNSIQHLLMELYITKEIAIKEEKISNCNLEQKKELVEKIYEKYINLSLDLFRNYLKNNINIKFGEINNSDELVKQSLKIFPLILTTADGFLFNFKNIIDSKDKIDCIIIDEASQCDVLTGLPLLFMAKKIVVVGDSKQLGAITEKYIKTDIDKIYQNYNNNFLNTIKTVFNPPTQLLLEHYRCDYNIINFCNKYYYDNQLKIYSDNHQNSISIIDVEKYKGAEKIDGKIFNKREIKSIKENIKCINDTFIITPFRGQADLLKENFNKESCGTIHSFQGKGAKNVYFSTVLNDLDFCNNHLNGPNLFSKELVNVAISRAKDKFILVCDKNYFEKNKQLVPDIKNLIDYIKIYGSEIEDTSVSIFDYLYKNIKYYKSNKIFDNEYEEVLFNNINDILINTVYKCYPKLKLVDLVHNKDFLEGNINILKYILNGAHADFTIIDKRINKPILVIELDGKYHNNNSQKLKDEYKNKSLEASNINLFRISSHDTYDKEELKKEIFDRLLF